MPAQQRLWVHDERRPTRARQHPAERRHEQPVATAKTRPARLALEHRELLAQDHDLDVVVQVAGRAGRQPDCPAQQQIDDGEEHEAGLLQEEGRSYETCWLHRQSRVSVPFTQVDGHTTRDTGHGRLLPYVGSAHLSMGDPRRCGPEPAVPMLTTAPVSCMNEFPHPTTSQRRVSKRRCIVARRQARPADHRTIDFWHPTPMPCAYEFASRVRTGASSDWLSGRRRGQAHAGEGDGSDRVTRIPRAGRVLAGIAPIPAW